MFIYLFIVFTTIPLIEIALLIKIGQYIGTFNTILIVVITGIAGASLAKYQGLQVFFSIKEELSNGRLPAAQLFDGLLILISAVLLITPGLLTDTLGFLLLVPVFRKLVRNLIKSKLSNMVLNKQINIRHIN